MMAITPNWSGEIITFGAGEQYVTTFNNATITALYSDAYFEARNKWKNPALPEYVGVQYIQDGAKFHYTATFDGYITFRALPGDQSLGAYLWLYKPYLTPGLGNTVGVADYHQGFKVASITYPVTTGDHLVLDVKGEGSEDITLTAERTYGRPDCDDFNSPEFVIITEDGGTYQSPKVLNDYLTRSVDDPSGTTLYRTCWFTYSSPHSGQVSYTANADPESATDVHAVVWGYNSSNVLYKVAEFTQGQTWSETVAADTPRHIQIGQTAENTNTRGVYFDLQVVGRRTHAQPPNPPPDNDLRANAALVSITTEGATFTSTPVLNTYATNDNDDGSDDPVAEGLYRTLWWKYIPRTSGTYSVELVVTPDSPDCVLEEWQIDSSGHLFPTNTVVSNQPIKQFTDEVHYGIEPSSTRLYVIGTLTESTEGLSYVLKINGPVTVTPVDDDPNPPFNPPPDQYDPNAPQDPPKDNTVQTSSLLELIRAFSAKIKRAVRIVDAGIVPAHGSTPSRPWATISLCDPGATNKLQTKSGASLYAAAMDEQKMGTIKTLSVNKDIVTKSASSTLLKNDASILVSGWRIPDALPLPGVNNSPTGLQPVKTVRMSFTPDEFSCDIEFHPIY